MINIAKNDIFYLLVLLASVEVVFSQTVDSKYVIGF